MSDTEKRRVDGDVGAGITTSNDADTGITTSPSPSASPPTFTPDVQTKKSPWRRILAPLLYVPPRCRWDPSAPPTFSMAMNVLFAFAAGFTVANLYYSYPILDRLARDFDVEYERVAQIPTAMQAGYAAGLLFVCPLGDLVPRRPFVVGLVGGTGCLW